MRKYYTRACNFYYGNYAKKLIKGKKALPLAGNLNIAFDQLEIFYRKKKGSIRSKVYSIAEIKDLDKKILSLVKIDLKKIVSKRKSICGIKFSNPQIMGVLNITPDSFSDGGLYFGESEAYDQVNLMLNDGAKIIDVGGESTRPGSKTVRDKDEWDRIKNTIIKLKKNFSNKILSLDTRKSYVMKRGIECGVDIINDVSGLNFDKKSINKKIKKESIIIDPGIGFGKNLKHNLRIMSKISTFHSLGCPILIGTSKKRFIEHIVTKFDTPDRTGGTLASVLYGLLQGVQLFRVHDVKEINQGILVFNKILNTN